MNNRPTPETDGQPRSIGIGCGGTYSMVNAEFARRLERERDEAREEIRDWKRLHDAAERGVDLTIAEGTISDLLKQRDEAREALKKCREDSICYAEHMRMCGYSEAYKESKENADRAERILKETK